MRILRVALKESGRGFKPLQSPVASRLASGASPGQKSRVDTHGEREKREPITESGGGAPRGVQGRAPDQGFRGAKPHKAENLLAFDAQRKQQNSFILRILQTS